MSAAVVANLTPAGLRKAELKLAAREAFDPWTGKHGTARPAQLPPEGTWRTWLIMAGRGFGKALALDTPIPTPAGWTTMGELKVGDEVYDENGKVCRVTFATPVQINRTCYDVVFSDGTVIVADAEHRWLTIDRKTRKALARRTGTTNRHDRPQSRPRYAPSVVTTDEIRATLYDGKEVNHAIPVTEPIWGAVADLPIDPYVFGLWLGDGSSKGAEITTADEEMVRFVQDAGYVIGRRVSAGGRSFTFAFSTGDTAEMRRDGTTGRYMSVAGNVVSDLRSLGVYQNKHIPIMYLRSSVDQRMALLQGLMDTDGSITKGGSAEYVTVSDALARDVHELIVSLGFKVSWMTDRARVNGKDCGPRHRLTFTPHRPVFRLPRKLERQHTGKGQAERTRRRYIVDVRPRESVPVRCIQVDSPSHLFLASRAMIPTHNTRTGAEFIRKEIQAGRMARVALVGPTASDVRDVMVEGESGLLEVCRRAGFGATYNPSRRRVTFDNGAVAFTYSADEPNRLRGPQHDGFWADEIAAWRYIDAWDQLQFGLRLGENPRGCATTTPRPIKIVRDLLANPSTAVTRGSTYDNRDNLADAFFEQIITRYEGTTLGRQELMGELIEDVEGALWNRALIDRGRVRPDAVPDLVQIAVAVDPATTHGENSDQTGIAVAGRSEDGEFYVLHAGGSRVTPNAWANTALDLYERYEANEIVAESNQGGEMVKHTILTAARDRGMRAPRVRLIHASRGKQVRAEPVVALYERGLVHHVGVFGSAEDEMCVFPVGGEHDDQVDALVHALTAVDITRPRGKIVGF